MEETGTKMAEITACFIESDGPKDPARRVRKWAGATPVWAPLGRPDLLACVAARRSLPPTLFRF